LRGTKRLTILAVLSMALALGANTAIFGLLDAIVLRPLPVRNPEQLVALRYSTPQATTLTSFSLPMADQLAVLPVFEAMLVRANNSQNVTVAGATQRAMVEIVSENYFTTLGVGAQLGRVFSASPANDEEPVAVLSYGYWQRRFGASASAIGARIAINDYPVTVIGVMPAEFDGTDPGVPPDLRVPLRIHPRILPWNAFGKPNQRSFELFARVRDGYTVRQAEAAAQIAYRHDPNIQSRTPAETLHADPAPGGRSRLRSRYQAPLIALQLLLLLCLVLACANVANLLAALSQGRRREIAVRLAIGSSRGRLMRQLITEGLLLASISCALGLVFARWAATLLIGEIPMGLSPVSLQFSLDWRIAAFAWVLTLLTGVAFGCLPAMQSMRTDLVTGLRGSSTSAGGISRTPATLGAVQVAVSLILLSVAALFVRSLRTIEAIDPGYRLDHMIVATVAPSNKWPAAAVDRFYREAAARLSSVNGVRGVGFINNGLLIGNTWTTQVDVAGG
jgi:predicted permease